MTTRDIIAAAIRRPKTNSGHHVLCNMIVLDVPDALEEAGLTIMAKEDVPG